MTVHDDFEKQLLASIRKEPLLSAPERARKLNVPTHKVQKTTKNWEHDGNDVLKRKRIKVVSKIANQFPELSINELAKKLGASVSIVWLVLTEIETPEQLENRSKHAERLTEEQQSQRADDIRREIVENPFLTLFEIQKKYKVKRSFVENIARRVREHFNRRLECEILLAEYVDSHPSATLQDAAKHFNVPPFRIMSTKGADRLRVSAAELDYRKSTAEGWENNSDVDFLMERQLYLRPSWYVEETVGKGYLGVCLPENEFKLYLEIRERRKRTPTREIPLPKAVWGEKSSERKNYEQR